MPEYPHKLLAASQGKRYLEDIFGLNGIINDDLAIAWRVMRQFSLMVNLSTQIKGFVYPEIIQQTMAAVMYRLLHMEFPVRSMNSVIRLGLLAFTYHVFLQWRDVRLPYRHFRTAYEDCITDPKLPQNAPSRLMLWLLITGAISILDLSEDPWPRPALQYYVQECQVKTWKDMRELLKSFMWISVLDDQLGERIFDSLSSEEGE